MKQKAYYAIHVPCYGVEDTLRALSRTFVRGSKRATDEKDRQAGIVLPAGKMRENHTIGLVIGPLEYEGIPRSCETFMKLQERSQSTATLLYYYPRCPPRVGPSLL